MSFTDNPLPPEPEPQAGVGPPEMPVAPEPWRPGHENPAWSFWDVVRVAVVALLSIGFFSVIVLSIASHNASQKATAIELARDPEIVVPAQVAAYVIVVAFMAGTVRARGSGFWSGVRWNWPAPAWLGFFGLGIGLAIAVQAASALLPIPKSLPIDRYFTNATGAYVMAGFGTTAAPLVEELFFRGFLYPVVARRLGLGAGVGLTALAFALIHESQLAQAWAPLLLLFGVGVVLTTVRARTGSVGASFLVHVGYNGTLFFLLFLASDHFRHLERIG